MAKANNPITLSKKFGITERELSQLGVLNATLAIDTQLFVDPLLFQRSAHPEMRDEGAAEYNSHFEKVIRLLAASRSENDPAWVAARKSLVFPEIRGTCLGYGAGSIHGRGFSGALTDQVIRVAHQIVTIGITDPDLFQAMALFESNIGPDRISDMATNIIYRSLVRFNSRILGALSLSGESFRHRGVEGTFLANPYEAARTPVILMPVDILKDLPTAQNWDEIADAARHNDELRDSVNEHIGSIWAIKTQRDKEQLKDQALRSKDAFEALLKAIKTRDALPYDVEADPEGLIRWATKGQDYADRFPFALALRRTQDLSAVFDVVKAIVEQFRHLVENNGLNKELYKDNKKPKHESTAQRLFFAVAYAYCKANNIDVSPEIDTGTGKIDFKFSVGFAERVLVEVKLSTNGKVVPGYMTQLEIYKQSQETMKAIYLIIDVGRMGRKGDDLIKLRNLASKRKEPLSDLEFVDGIIRPSPSKRR